IRDQYAAEAIEHLSEKIAFPRGSKDINSGVGASANPYVTGPGPQLDFRFVDIEDRTREELRQKPFIGPAIVAGEQIAEGQEFRRVHVNPEHVVKKYPQRLHAQPMRNLMIHGPAHEAMKVLGQAIVAVRDEGLAALRALIGGRPDLNDL